MVCEQTQNRVKGICDLHPAKARAGLVGGVKIRLEIQERLTSCSDLVDRPEMMMIKLAVTHQLHLQSQG